MKLIITVAQRMILCFNDKFNYIMKIAKEINVTFSTAIKSINSMKEDGIFESKRVGRKNILKLTEKGKYIQKLLRELKKLE